MKRAPTVEVSIRLGSGLLVLGLVGCPAADDASGTTSGADGSTGDSGAGMTPPGVTGASTSGGDTSTGPGADSGSGTGDPDTGSTTSPGTTGPGTTDGTTGGTDTGGSSSGGLVCDAPEENCDGECVDTTMSAEHCGACDDPCRAGGVCVESMCVTEQELIVNGDFASGLDDWTTSNNPDQVATCNGALDDEILVFSDGGGFVHNAMPSTGPSSHVIYQDFDVPPGISAVTFSMEYAQDPLRVLDPVNVQTIVKDCLDENMDGTNQNAFRIDLIDPNDDVFVAPIAFEIATPDVSAGDPLDAPPTLVNVTVTDGTLLTYLQGEEGNTLRLRIAQVESTLPWNIAFDDVSVYVALD